MKKYEIHIQNDKVRLALSEKDFLQMASVIVLAKKQLDIIKRGNKMKYIPADVIHNFFEETNEFENTVCFN